ncbi:HPP family protein [Kitasatospora aureofaciens]|uniref:HPP family protein n=1 Tax=Kitasatospora aureofaciens TaxID=1894 RepID=UPI001C456BC6|nr:HPP family protein [Kitasatospora aureofaciens]MBV6699935.1 HPP family protein [Kitasatospora aureofaciens]
MPSSQWKENVITVPNNPVAPSEIRGGASGIAGSAAKQSLLVSKAPPRPSWAVVAVATAAGVAGLVLLVAVGSVMDRVLLIPPLAASAALVYGAPALPLSQPRSVIGGQLLSAVVGFLVLWSAGSSTWTAAIAGGLALGAMQIARTPHSPAAATAVIVAATKPDPLVFLPLLGLATVLLVLVGVAVGRTGPGTRYPAYWW